MNVFIFNKTEGLVLSNSTSILLSPRKTYLCTHSICKIQEYTTLTRKLKMESKIHACHNDCNRFREPKNSKILISKSNTPCVSYVMLLYHNGILYSQLSIKSERPCYRQPTIRKIFNKIFFMFFSPIATFNIKIII